MASKVLPYRINILFQFVYSNFQYLSLLVLFDIFKADLAPIVIYKSFLLRCFIYSVA